MGFEQTQKRSLTCYLLHARPWANQKNSLGLSLLICKMGIVVAPISSGCCEYAVSSHLESLRPDTVQAG